MSQSGFIQLTDSDQRRESDGPDAKTSGLSSGRRKPTRNRFAARVVSTKRESVSRGSYERRRFCDIQRRNTDCHRPQAGDRSSSALSQVSVQRSLGGLMQRNKAALAEL